ncbi:hypothetical protein ES703_33189 [subsurface metagenome]|nr:hypothetical protein [Dehalococcoidia bacterium]
MNPKWLNLVGILLLIVIFCIGCSDVKEMPAPPGPPKPPPPGVKYIYPEESSTPSAPKPSPSLAPVPTSGPKNPRYIYEDGAIHVGADGEPIGLINNPDATNPTHKELLAFIKEDTSDSKIYFKGFERQGEIILARVCADFAEEVHNNAEAKGIKAAWVGIDFKGEEDGHALNAFETTDRGLVYVDCTGEDTLGSQALRQLKSIDAPTSWDKIAYVEVGKIYGAIYIDYAKSLSYDFYETYKRKWQECEEILCEYNDEVLRYNREIAGKIYYVYILNDSQRCWEKIA